MFSLRVLTGIVMLILLGVPTSVFAHDIYASHGFNDGFLHPFLGFDHLFGVLAVGLLAMKAGKHGRFAVPTAFIGFMLFGAVIGMLDVPMMWVKQGMSLSVIAFGAALLLGRELPLSFSQAVVGIFALFHGHAYGSEIPALANPVWYSLGFVVGCSLLILFGMILAWYVKQIASQRHWMTGLGGVVISLGLISFVL